jgi:DNA-binding LacI/PurR family transcriptional regulator
MSTKKAGIREISEQAGVAMSTVSHALNGTATISDQVRSRVLGVARDLGYLDRRQAKGAIATLGKVMIVVPEGALPDNDVNLVSWTILSALSRDCEARGLKLVPFSLHDDRPVAEVISAARSSGVDGIILLNDDRNDLLEAICATGIPAVLINGEDPNMHVDSVTPGNRFAAQKAVNWLISLGHRRIMHLTWPGRKTVRRRLDGFKDAMAEHDLPETAAVVVMAQGFEPHYGEAAVAEWLARTPDLAGISAIFSAADNLAFGAIKALKAAGIRVPEDISVMGFDGVALGELHVPALTTVSIPLEQFGREALSLLEQRALARGGRRASHRLELGCEIVERASVAAPKPR